MYHVSGTKQGSFGFGERVIENWTDPTWGNSLKFHVLPIPAVGVLQVLQILQLGSMLYCILGIEES